MLLRLSVVLALLWMATLESFGGSTDSIGARDVPDFSRDIRPILSENCFQCHGPDKETRKAGLRLDTRDGIFEERGGYHPVFPGDLDASELYSRITSSDEDERMPPKASNRSLSEAQIDLIRRWIENGAPWNQHWAYIAPVRPDVPTEIPKDFRATNPIDHFVAQKLMEVGLSQSDRA
ncbi:MAG: hypothetical protein KC931_20690, partial [Candidatus Omnitrophica bacterium]|nr:hypothetical protein [Candidatus Omnitrophota bacterium]